MIYSPHSQLGNLRLHVCNRVDFNSRWALISSLHCNLQLLSSDCTCANVFQIIIYSAISICPKNPTTWAIVQIPINIYPVILTWPHDPATYSLKLRLYVWWNLTSKVNIYFQNYIYIFSKIVTSFLRTIHVPIIWGIAPTYRYNT